MTAAELDRAILDYFVTEIADPSDVRAGLRALADQGVPEGREALVRRILLDRIEWMSDNLPPPTVQRLVGMLEMLEAVASPVGLSDAATARILERIHALALMPTSAARPAPSGAALTRERIGEPSHSTDSWRSWLTPLSGWRAVVPLATAMACVFLILRPAEDVGDGPRLRVKGIARFDRSPAAAPPTQEPSDHPLDVRVDRGRGGRYLVGDSLRLTILAPVRGYVTMLDLSTSGRVSILAKNRLVAASERFEMTASVTAPAGIEEVIGLVSTQPLGSLQDLVGPLPEGGAATLLSDLHRAARSAFADLWIGHGVFSVADTKSSHDQR